MNRSKALLKWTQKQLGDADCYIEPASSDASFRSYWRAYSRSETYILMDAPPDLEDCRPFINISEKLIQSNVNAAKVLDKNLELGFLMLSDLGSIQYLNKLNSGNFERLYDDALITLHKIQQHTSQTNLNLYNKDILLAEMQLFETWFIDKHLGIQLKSKQLKSFQDCQNILIDNALEQPQTFVHRDFHSRNLMYLIDNNPGVLDFQDALIGPVTYDLVSLLKDCYICWPENSVNLISNNFRIQYNQLNQMDISENQWQRWFDLMGMQRHLKAIGIFCRLNYRDNKPNYLKDLNVTFNYIKSVCKKYPELKQFLTLIKSISPSIESICVQ